MNNQQIVKILNYFRINHGYHSPFTFLIDGNFLKLLVQKDIDLQEKLKPIVPGKVKIKVTNCTLTQLQMLGHDFIIIFNKAKQMQPIKCSHTFQSVDRCILDNSSTQSNLIVCSQDKFLRRRLRFRNVGIMYFGPDQRITMEDIERHQYQDAKQAERQKFMPAQNQRSQLQEYRQQQNTLQKLKKKRQQFKLASTRGVQLKYIKKKPVKGPNPLSVKKKQHRFSAQFNAGKDQQKIQQYAQQQGQKKKRIRKRNKSKKLENQNEQANEEDDE